MILWQCFLHLHLNYLRCERGQRVGILHARNGHSSHRLVAKSCASELKSTFKTARRPKTFHRKLVGGTPLARGHRPVTRPIIRQSRHPQLPFSIRIHQAQGHRREATLLSHLRRSIRSHPTHLPRSIHLISILPFYVLRRTRMLNLHIKLNTLQKTTTRMTPGGAQCHTQNVGEQGNTLGA